MYVNLDSLSCRRGGRLLFDNLSTELRPGTVLMVRGPNGSGKSSLLRILAGFLAAESGRIHWADGANGPWQEDGLESQVAYLAHANGVKSQLTVRENLHFWTALTDSRQKDPREALALMGLAALEDMQAGLLSAGQQRRLALCRLPLTGRPLWLLDEPDTALDTASKAALADMITAHMAQGGLTVIASHGVMELPNRTTLTLATTAQTEGPA